MKKIKETKSFRVGKYLVEYSYDFNLDSSRLKVVNDFLGFRYILLEDFKGNLTDKEIEKIANDEIKKDKEYQEQFYY